MADLIGTATIRVDMGTTAAVRSIRRMVAQTDGPLRTLQRRIAATSAELGRLRGTSVSVTVDDRTAAGTASVRRTVRDLQALGPIQISTRLDADPTTIAATSSALRGLQDAARGASRTLATLTTRATTAAAALTALGAAARSLRGDMDDLDASILRTGGGMTALRGRLGTITTSAGGTSNALGALRSAALVLAPALIPIAVQAAPIAAGLTAATVAVGIFAAAAGGQIAKLSQAAEAEKKYKEAVDEHGATSAQAAQAQAALTRTMANMPQPTRVAAAALSGLKNEYRQWSDGLASDTMPVATKSFAVFGALFPKLTPVVRGASSQLDRFVTLVAGGVRSPGFDRFMTSFAEFSSGAMSKANDALVRFMRTLDTGEAKGGASEFMEYVRANGPLVRDTLSKLGQVLGNVLQAAADAGPGLLTVVNALAGLVAAVPPGVITTMLQLALALKAVRLAAAGMAAASLGATAFATAIGGMRTAAAGATGVLPRLAAAMGTLSRAAKVAVAGTGIGLLVIALGELSQRGRTAPPDVDKLTNSLSRLGKEGKVAGEAAKAFGSDLGGLYGKVSSLTDPSTTDKVQQFLVGWTGWDSTPVKDAKQNLDAVDKSLANLVKDGRADLAAAALKRLTAEYAKGGRDTKEFTGRLDDYKGAIEDAKFEQKLTADAMGLFGQQAQQTSAKLAEQKASADGLRQAIQALNDVNRAGLSGMIGFEASIDAASQAAQENAGVLSMQAGQLTLNTDKQRAAATALNDLAAKTDEAAGAARENGESWGAVSRIYERGRGELIKNAMAMGLNRAEAKQLADQIMATPNKTALLKADITDWKTKIGEAEKQLKTAKGDKRAKLTADIADWKANVAKAELQLKGTKADKKAKLTADIADWRAKVATAELQLRTAKGEKRAKLTANIDDWRRKIGAAQTQINNLPPSRTTTLTVRRINEIITKSKTYRSVHDIVGGATGGLFTGRDFKHRGKGYARGGLVDGPGTETSDSVPAPWLSKNEFVVNAKQTAKHLPLLKAINSGGLGMASGGMTGAGADAGAGLASGITEATGAVRAAAKTMASAVSEGVRQELQISSPSRVMKALAKDVGKGFIDGMTASRDKIKAVSKDLAGDIRAAFSGKKESGLLKMVASETKELLKLADKRDDIAKRIADARKFASSVADEARSTGSLASIVQEDHYSPKYVKQQMQASLNQIKTFTANVEKLKKKGLNKDLLKQILEMGPEQGAAFAASLAGADKATIKEYNSLNTKISSASSKLGKSGADMLYDSGKKAGDGFLTGLMGQQKKIEKLMLDIAKGMQAAIKKALGIQSPSTVFAAIGKNIGDGLARGITDSHPKVSAAAKKMGVTAATATRAAKTRSRGRASAVAKRSTQSGFGGAVGELKRLVETGKWKKPGSHLFEDISFQNMSANFRRQQMKVADGFWEAVAEIKKAVRSGKSVFEDMTFKGMSNNVSRFHDVIAQLWKGNPYGRNFGDWGNWGAYKRYGKYAGGGLITGGGTGTSDSIPIWASNREFMMRTAAVDYYGLPTMRALNSMRIPRSAIASRTGATARSAPPTEVHHHYHLTVENRGVIGSPMQVQDWLAKALDNLARTNRLPTALRGAA